MPNERRKSVDFQASKTVSSTALFDNEQNREIYWRSKIKYIPRVDRQSNECPEFAVFRNTHTSTIRNSFDHLRGNDRFLFRFIREA